MDSVRPARPRPRIREPHELPGPWAAAALPGGHQRNGDPLSIRLDAVREQGRPAGRQPLRHHLRRQRAVEGAWRARAVERGAGDHVHSSAVIDGRAIIERCDVLAACTDEPGRITRPFASDAMRRAHQYVREWMRQAGMTVTRDNIGNLRGRYEGTGDATLLLGSHLDSVRDAGKYDGPLGVMVALAAVQRLHDDARQLPFGIQVLAFADEEGLRYGSTYLGSRAVAGTFDSRDLERTDAAGVTMAEAIRAFGGDPTRIADDNVRGDLLGYCEVHIEQGPVLEARALPVGVVSAIAGQSRMLIELTGQAGHAGTVPMDRRRDALTAAAELVLAVEAAATTQPGLVAMSALTGACMLFVRCKGGVSHNPAESVTAADVSVAIDVLGRFLALLARRWSSAGGRWSPRTVSNRLTSGSGTAGSPRSGRISLRTVRRSMRPG